MASPKAKRRCAAGEILRDGYWRRAHSRELGSGREITVQRTYVPPACIRNVGAPGKGITPPIPSLGPDGKIPTVGYNVQDPPRYRKAAVARAVQRYGRPMTYWRLSWEGEWRQRAPKQSQRRAWSKTLLSDARWLANATKSDLRKLAKPLRETGCPSGKTFRRGFTYERDGKRVTVPPSCIKK